MRLNSKPQPSLLCTRYPSLLEMLLPLLLQELLGQPRILPSKVHDMQQALCQQLLRSCSVQRSLQQLYCLSNEYKLTVMELLQVCSLYARLGVVQEAHCIRYLSIKHG